MSKQKTAIARDSNRHHNETEKNHGHLEATIRRDISLAGMLRLTNIDEQKTNRLLSSIAPDLAGTVHLTGRQVKGIGGH